MVRHKEKSALVFSVDGNSAITKRALLYHFKRMLEPAGIGDFATRDIVPYSFRHFMITQRIMSGVNFPAIADMCGTSITQIERTYYHLNEAILLTNAVADYRVDSDGMIWLV